MPSLRALIWSGPASNPMTMISPSLPACLIPVAAPCAENKLLAKMAFRSGLAAMAAVVI